MLIDLFLLLLFLASFEGKFMDLDNDNIFPRNYKELLFNLQLTSKWSFMAVIVYGRRVVCAGTAVTETWVITVAHCVHGNLKEKSLARFGLMSVRLGPEPIEYKKIKEIQINSTGELEDEDYYVPVVDPQKLLTVTKIVVHPEYIYTEMLPNARLSFFVGINDLALVKFRQGPKFTIPSLVLYPGFSGKCEAAGWALYKSKVPQANHSLYELKFNIGTEWQCKPYLELTAELLPDVLKGGYKRNKICSLLYGDGVFTHGVDDGDEGGPLVCGNRLQGIISHYYVSSNGDYLSFFYDLTQFVGWIGKVIVDVEEFGYSKQRMDENVDQSTTTTRSTTSTTSTIIQSATSTASSTTRSTTSTTSTASTGIYFTHSDILDLGKQLIEVEDFHKFKIRMDSNSHAPNTITTFETTHTTAKPVYNVRAITHPTPTTPSKSNSTTTTPTTTKTTPTLTTTTPIRTKPTPTLSTTTTTLTNPTPTLTTTTPTAAITTPTLTGTTPTTTITSQDLISPLLLRYVSPNPAFATPTITSVIHSMTSASRSHRMDSRNRDGPAKTSTTPSSPSVTSTTTSASPTTTSFTPTTISASPITTTSISPSPTSSTSSSSITYKILRSLKPKNKPSSKKISKTSNTCGAVGFPLLYGSTISVKVDQIYVPKEDKVVVIKPYNARKKKNALEYLPPNKFSNIILVVLAAISIVFIAVAVFAIIKLR